MENNQHDSIRLFLKRLRARLRGRDAAAQWPVEEGWQQLKSRIVEEEGLMSQPVQMNIAGPAEERRLKVRMGIFRVKYGYAAAVILVLLVGGGYWFLHSRHEQDRSNSAIARAVGVEKAVLAPTQGVQLILSDGRKVAVDRVQTLTEQGGVAIQTDSGSVNYQLSPDAKTGQLAFNTLEVPRGNKSRITLPDGTKVWINAASRLKYPTVFTGERREVELDGEAYFDVSRDPARPFVVHARGMDINVLGTAFNVNVYDPVFVTTLVSGKVSVKGKTAELTLEPGEQAMLSKMNGEAKKAQVNVSDFTAWKENDLFIGNLSFDKVATMLARQFDYDIVLADPTLEQLHFTIDMPAPKNLQEVLEHICSTTEGIRFSISGRRVILRKD